MRLRLIVCCVLLALFAAASQGFADRRPNILMIMVDDLGFSDLGCYGSEIQTPHLDRLASGGVRFSQFYNTAKCHSSRVSLLTGQYCIAAGDTALTHAVTTAEVLRSSGYFTAMTGKWHLKKEPTDFGFDRYWGHLSGACNYFSGDKSFRLNGESWTVPDEGFYTTVANVDYAIEFLDQARGSGKPWHLYIAFNAPHAPLQALAEDYAKYEGRYDEGWDVVRNRRLARQRELGLFRESTEPSPRPDHIPAWGELSPKRKDFESKRMTALAAMIDRVDQEVGRLVADLEDANELENTLIWFVSDNGACPYDRRSTKIEERPTNAAVSWSDSTGWAWARNSPFRFYKQNQFEGGICTPAIAHWPNGIKLGKGTIVERPSHLIDLMPTFADVADAAIPEEYDDRELRPVSGQSLAGLLSGAEFRRDQPLHFLFSSDRALRIGDWKAVSFRAETWELYDLSKDRTELNDLAKVHPERLQGMVGKWTDMSERVLHANKRSYAPVHAAKLPHRHPEWTDFTRDPVSGQNGKRISANDETKTKSAPANRIRARKNTKMKVDHETLVLRFTGEDSGLAWDRLSPSLPNGPYTLEFELKSTGQGGGDVFFVTNANAVLPQGDRISFAVTSDDQWHKHRIEIDTEKQIKKLRLDVGELSGGATIRGLRLIDASGRVLVSWPN